MTVKQPHSNNVKGVYAGRAGVYGHIPCLSNVPKLRYTGTDDTDQAGKDDPRTIPDTRPPHPPRCRRRNRY